ncbi:MAG: hypothetical protein AABZ65_08185 [Candidatus Omnitrophota bacterium]
MKTLENKNKTVTVHRRGRKERKKTKAIDFLARPLAATKKAFSDSRNIEVVR